MQEEKDEYPKRQKHNIPSENCSWTEKKEYFPVKNMLGSQ